MSVIEDCLIWRCMSRMVWPCYHIRALLEGKEEDSFHDDIDGPIEMDFR